MTTQPPKVGRKIYLPKTVDVALQERLHFAFDNFATVIVSVSGGKDSTAVFDAAQKMAKARGRKIKAFFLDQEAEYASTIDLVTQMLFETGDHVEPLWYQVPIRMTNATSYSAEFLNAWHPDEQWMREKHPRSIHSAPGAPDRFYPFLSWFESQWGPDTCFLVGLRAEEALNRYRAVTRNAALPGIPWSSRCTTAPGHAGPGAVRLYPIYDWAFEDIWTYLGKESVPYNRAYDWMWATGAGIADMRVSNLIHEHAFHALSTLQIFEPDTYERLLNRLDGVHTAALYAAEPGVYQTRQRPPEFATWKDYRDSLLQSVPEHRRRTFGERFAGQGGNEIIYRQQVRQLLLNDWENSIPVVNTSDEATEPRAALKKWMDIL